ncbi:7827_t:CDS:2 [Ambispora gerdemannii]|uniref:7827_t:CDS:1 n=1 Tax=Ambispora gerdemannii TaxID=144530 RepID=A0A9N9CJ98_9GLOM|nr:7827_t:CDS:2 [Ambispora gerdemannii]
MTGHFSSLNKYIVDLKVVQCERDEEVVRAVTEEKPRTMLQPRTNVHFLKVCRMPVLNLDTNITGPNQFRWLSERVK